MNRTYTPEFLQYVAGNFDGDGCVVVGTNECLSLGVDKAEKSMSVLKMLKENFGGNIYCKKKKTATTQAKYEWKVNGRQAYRVIELIKDYTHIKRQQLEVAYTFDMDYRVTVYATRDGLERKFESNTAAAKAFGRSESQMRRELWYYNACIDGWKFRVVRRDAAMKAAVTAQRKGVDLELRRLKHVPHNPIQGSLIVEYLSGLFDSEGCISVTSATLWKCAIPQGHSNILFALKRQFGGNVFVSKKTANRGCWTLYRIPGKPFLESIRPMLLEKGKQVDLVLKMTDDGARVNYELRKLKGNYTPKLTSAISQYEPEEELDEDGEPMVEVTETARGEAVVAPTVA